MALNWIGALLIIAGMVLMTTRTLRRGKLSDATPPPMASKPDTLEPRGPGRRLSLKADLPGLGLVALGAVLLLMAAALRTP